LFDQLAKSTVTPDVGLDIVKQIVSKKRALKLSELAFQVGQGLKTEEDLQSFLAESPVQATDALTLKEVDNDLEQLLSSHIYDQGLRWRLDCLNKSLGSLRKGDFGFIFARPETGKTTFLASEVTHFLDTSGGTICWLNNEEDGWKVMLRVYCSYFGVTSDIILSNVKKFKDIFQEEVGNSFRLFDSALIGRRDVERVVEKLQPSLVVYDQIDKIKGFNNDREDLRLGSIYQWARELAKGNHAAIGVCQADGHAEGVRYLTMEHVANAKTAKQAEADFILGIGKTNDPEMATARFLNICKNKLLGDQDSIPELRHGRFEVLIEPTIARYKDVIKFS
jgi:replicative DNA helicase